MSESRKPPGSMISVNDAARMIVRSSLIVAPFEMREEYASFVSPLSMGDKSYGDTGEVSPRVKEIFDGMVKAFEKLQFPEEKKATLKEIEEQVVLVLLEARRTIQALIVHQQKKKDKSTGIILEQLKVITENISTRKVVEAYPAAEPEFSGSYGSGSARGGMWKTKKDEQKEKSASGNSESENEISKKSKVKVSELQTEIESDDDVLEIPDKGIDVNEQKKLGKK